MSELSHETRTFILHEAPHKLRTTLADLAQALGDTRRIAICRELTKLNEEILRTTLSEAIALYREREPRGEYVLVIEGGSLAVRTSDTESRSIDEILSYYMKEGMSKNDAIKATAKELGLSRNEVYAHTIAQKD